MGSHTIFDGHKPTPYSAEETARDFVGKPEDHLAAPGVVYAGPGDPDRCFTCNSYSFKAYASDDENQGKCFSWKEQTGEVFMTHALLWCNRFSPETPDEQPHYKVTATDLVGNTVSFVTGSPVGDIGDPLKVSGDGMPEKVYTITGLEPMDGPGSWVASPVHDSWVVDAKEAEWKFPPIKDQYVDPDHHFVGLDMASAESVILSDAECITSLGVAAAISGQGALATKSDLPPEHPMCKSVLNYTVQSKMADQITAEDIEALAANIKAGGFGKLKESKHFEGLKQFSMSGHTVDEMLVGAKSFSVGPGKSPVELTSYAEVIKKAKEALKTQPPSSDTADAMLYGLQVHAHPSVAPGEVFVVSGKAFVSDELLKKHAPKDYGKSHVDSYKPGWHDFESLVKITNVGDEGNVHLPHIDVSKIMDDLVAKVMKVPSMFLGGHKIPDGGPVTVKEFKEAAAEHKKPEPVKYGQLPATQPHYIEHMPTKDFGEGVSYKKYLDIPEIDPAPKGPKK